MYCMFNFANCWFSDGTNETTNAPYTELLLKDLEIAWDYVER